MIYDSFQLRTDNLLKHASLITWYKVIWSKALLYPTLLLQVSLKKSFHMQEDVEGNTHLVTQN